MIAHVIPYARERLDALGFKEWEDAFNWENVPKTRLAKAYHLTQGAARPRKVCHDHTEMEVPLTIRLFKAPGRNTEALLDDAAELADSVVRDFVAARNRLTQAEIKNVFFNDQSVEPLNESNDNGVVIQLEFTMLGVVSTR